MKFFISHPSTRRNPLTALAADVLGGSSSLTVKNTSGFLTDKFIILGKAGFEQAEILRPTVITPPSTLGTLASNVVFPHNADDKVVLLDSDKINTYRSTTGINGVYEPFSTIDILIDQEMTPFEDTGAQANFYYRWAYLNSITNFETNVSDPIAATGFVFYSAKTMVDRVLSLFGDVESESVGRDEVMDYLNEFYEIAQQENAVVTKRDPITYFDITVENDVAEYALPGDFLMEKAVKVSKDQGRTFPYSAVQQNVDSMGSIFQTNVIYGYSIRNGLIKLDPIPANASDILRIYYVATPVTLAQQNDTLASPFQNRSVMFVRYGLGMCYLKDKKFDEWTRLRDDSTGKLRDFLSYIKRLQNRHPEFVEILDSAVL